MQKEKVYSLFIHVLERLESAEIALIEEYSNQEAEERAKLAADIEKLRAEFEAFLE